MQSDLSNKKIISYLFRTKAARYFSRTKPRAKKLFLKA
jgi:hypothetical protein